MDAMTINTTNNISRPSVAAISTRDRVNVQQRPDTSAQEKAIQTAQEDQRRTQQERQRENVVSMSQDGDTLQVNPSTEDMIARAQEGSVSRREAESSTQAQEVIKKQIEEQQAKAEARRQEAQKAAMEAARQNSAADARQNGQQNGQQITSFAGYSSSQLEQLYQRGQISKQDYDREVARRNENSQTQQENNSQLSQEAARLNGTMTRAQMDARAINGAFGQGANANSPATASQRVDAMQRVQDGIRTNETLKNNEGRRTWDYQLRA